MFFFATADWSCCSQKLSTEQNCTWSEAQGPMDTYDRLPAPWTTTKAGSLHHAMLGCSCGVNCLRLGIESLSLSSLSTNWAKSFDSKLLPSFLANPIPCRDLRISLNSCSMRLFGHDLARLVLHEIFFCDAWCGFLLRGSPLRPFPRVPLCPRNIPKLLSSMGLVAVWIWASLHLIFHYYYHYCSFVFGRMGVACWVWASNRSANFAACPVTRCYKKPELLGWDPPHPPRKSITDFKKKKTIWHKKLYGSFAGRPQARLFVTEGIIAKKAHIQ